MSHHVGGKDSIVCTVSDRMPTMKSVRLVYPSSGPVKISYGRQMKFQIICPEDTLASAALPLISIPLTKTADARIDVSAAFGGHRFTATITQPTRRMGRSSDVI
jgi:hypothetical protein